MPQKKTITLALGGIRSGKTAWAESYALKHGGLEHGDLEHGDLEHGDLEHGVLKHGSNPADSLCYLATGQKTDAAMTARIERHRIIRDTRFATIEEPLDIAPIIQIQQGGVVLVDSIGTWITNLMLDEADIDLAVQTLINALNTSTASVILVSEETGFGIIPDNAMARGFCDAIGMCNQRIAACADCVLLIIAGQTLVIKGEQIL